MGYSATTIYLHFRNKDQLVHALISDGMEKLKGKLRPVLDDLSVSPLIGIRRVCREYATFGLENPGYYEIMYVLQAEEISIYPEPRYRDARSLINDLSQLFERGMQVGEIRPSNPFIAANILWSQIHGVVSLIHSKRFDRQLDDKELVEQAIDAAILACASLTPSGNSREATG
jgi:AcrR family transcriptional regulator